MSDDLFIKEGIAIPSYELIYTASRSSGPGGQHANKTSSRITLHWSLKNTQALTPSQKRRAIKKIGYRLTEEGVLQIYVEESRNQHRNKTIAQERLREIVVDALKMPKRRIETKPTFGSKKRRVHAKKARGATKTLRKKPDRDT